jgi:hypothetical protein
MRTGNGIMFALLVIVCATASHKAFADGNKLSVALPFVSFTKLSDDGSTQGRTVAGVEAAGGYFFSNHWSVDACFDLNIEQGNMTAVFIGGDGFASYYLAGGARKKIVTDAFQAEALPKFNASVFAGAGARSFNFNAFDTSKGQITKRAANNQARGSFLGPVFGASISLETTPMLMVVGKAKMLKGLSDEITPSITLIAFSLGLEVML